MSPIQTFQWHHYRFPNIIGVCQNWGVDVFKEPIPVAPAAHYWMGGVKVDLNYENMLKNLEIENGERAISVKQNKVIYGPVAYKPKIS